MDFVEWYKIGCTTLMAGDCPTFFPLPSLTPGSEHYLQAHGDLPSHVHKSGGHGGDQLQVGKWTDGLPGPGGRHHTGEWVQTPGSTSVLMDRGQTHASKDFWDPVKSRRILWFWGTVPSGIQTIPREMTYHPGLKQIVHAPAAEMMELRTGTIADLGSASLKPGKPLKLAAANAANLEVVFAMPKQNTTLSIAIGGGSVVLNYVPPTGDGKYAAQVGFGKFTDTLPLLPEDKQLSLSIFLDGTVGEAYWQGGRVAMTFAITPTKRHGHSANITSSAAADLASATSYAMGSIYTSTEVVLASPRLSTMEISV